jgi:hypothetical protein
MRALRVISPAGSRRQAAAADRRLPGLTPVVINESVNFG